MTDIPAGRDLDARVHADVMGLCVHQWKITDDPDGDAFMGDWLAICEKCGDTRAGHSQMLGPVSGRTPHYSTSIADAWLVVEKLRAEGGEFGMVSHSEDVVFPERVTTWTANSYNPDRASVCDACDHRDSGSVSASADTAPHAICLAALDAVR